MSAIQEVARWCLTLTREAREIPDLSPLFRVEPHLYFSSVAKSCNIQHYAVAPQGEAATVISVQNETSFTYNLTKSLANADRTLQHGEALYEPVFWAPSRQILNRLSSDILIVGGTSQELDTSLLTAEYGLSDDEVDSYIECNNIVQTFLHRNGPIYGGLVNSWLGFNNKIHWTTMVDEQKWLRCYDYYDIGNAPLVWAVNDTDTHIASGKYTKCISVGTGWDDGYKAANYSITGRYYENLMSYGPGSYVNVHLSGKAAFLYEGKLPDGLDDACIIKNSRVPTNASCDWHAFWQTGEEDTIKHRSKAITTIEMLSFNNTQYDQTGDQAAFAQANYPYNTTLVIDFVTFETFADYMLDPSPITNPLYTTAYTLNLSKTATLDDVRPVMLDPAWTLAAWTADAGQLMSVTDTMGRLNLLNAFEIFWSTALAGEVDPFWSGQKRINAVGLMPVIQTLSMIDFNTSTVSPGATLDSEHPRLQQFAIIQVYAYGISSRTSWMGVVVASIGCVVVLLEVMLGFIDRRRFRSLTQLLVAALEHQYTDEFRGVHDEKTISRVPFRLKHDTRTAGRFKFEKVG